MTGGLRRRSHVSQRCQHSIPAVILAAFNVKSAQEAVDGSKAQRPLRIALELRLDRGPWMKVQAGAFMRASLGASFSSIRA
jgi:hypothetical protein